MSIKLKSMVILMILLTACANTVDKKKNQVRRVENVRPTSSPMSSSAAPDGKKDDNSVRAIGTHPDGRILIKPVSKANVAPLGTPSCYGLATDLSWSGDYEAVRESTSSGISSKVMTFPADFEIVQPNDAVVEMHKFTMGETDIFAYVQRYSDCHALEMYLFGVSDGKAFPIKFEMKPGQFMPRIDQFPHRPFQVTKDELIVTGGYGAGQDFTNVYHFLYDAKKHLMNLQKIDQRKPNDIPSQN